MAQDYEDDAGQSEKKGGTLKWIIIILVLIGLGVGAFFMKDTIMSMVMPNDSQETAENSAEESKETESVKRDPDFQGEMATIAPFVANLNDPLGKRYIKIGFEVELVDVSAVDSFEKYIIKIKNMLLILLGSKTPQEMLGPKNQIRLQQEIVDRINLILGEGKVLNIYFSTYILQ